MMKKRHYLQSGALKAAMMRFGYGCVLMLVLSTVLLRQSHAQPYQDAQYLEQVQQQEKGEEAINMNLGYVVKMVGIVLAVLLLFGAYQRFLTYKTSQQSKEDAHE